MPKRNRRLFLNPALAHHQRDGLMRAARVAVVVSAKPPTPAAAVAIDAAVPGLLAKIAQQEARIGELKLHLAASQAQTEKNRRRAELAEKTVRAGFVQPLPPGAPGSDVAMLALAGHFRDQRPPTRWQRCLSFTFGWARLRSWRGRG